MTAEQNLGALMETCEHIAHQGGCLELVTFECDPHSNDPSKRYPASTDPAFAPFIRSLTGHWNPNGQNARDPIAFEQQIERVPSQATLYLPLDARVKPYIVNSWEWSIWEGISLGVQKIMYSDGQIECHWEKWYVRKDRSQGST